MDNIVSVKLDSRYASTLGVWQYDYGQVLRITGPELPPAVEVQFSLDEKSGETLSRVGTTVDGVTEVKIPDELLTHSATSNYRIYVYIYLTDETFGNTKYEITIPVRVRSKPTSPTEDPETDPDLFRETVVAVNASAERAENAASSAMESAASAEETLIEIKRVTDGISEDIENANTAKSELSGMIDSAGIEKKELESSIGKAGEAKTALDRSIRSAGEKQLALDTTVEQANTVDASLKEQIGSAEQIQANVEQIAKNKADISSLNEDLADLQDKKITKFYASNQGENHLDDSDKGLVQDIKIYGQSEQSSTTGAQLFNENIEIKNRGVTIKINGSTATFKGTVSDEANARVNYQKNIKLKPGKYTASSSNEKIKADFSVKKANNEMIYNEHIEIDGTEKEVKIRVLFGLKPSAKGDVINETTNIMLNDGDIALPYEPYTGGKPSPSPDYPQEIKSVVNPVVKVCGKNLYNARAYPLIGNGYNGLTVQKKDDYYTIVGTATAETVLWLCGSYNNRTPLFTLKKGNYALTSSLTIYSSTGDVRKKVTGIFSIDEDYPVTGVCAAYQKGDVLNNKLYVQIEKGSEATSYEPYTEQSVQLPYTLNAIPVASGGNVTIDGQQWVCDEVDLVRGVKVQRVKVRELSPDDEWAYRKLASGNNNFQVRILNADVAIDGKPCFCNILPFKNVIWDDSIQNLPKIYANKQEITVSFPPSSEYSSLEAFKHMLTDVKSVIYYILATPIETPLTQEEASAFKQLMTYYPVTNISVTSDQLDGYTVFNYPISMANGWNYVKQQLNDNRDYIYDMDIQSAEAYVNSEYAVALTELEHSCNSEITPIE